MEKQRKQICIRNAQHEDLADIYMSERAYIVEFEPESLDKWDRAKETIMASLKDNIDKMVVITVDNVLAGHAYWAMYDGVPCVYSIYVLDEFRRMGLASKLMHAIEKDISENGFSKVSLSTLVINPAQYLFAKLGYVKTKTEDGWIHYIKHL